MWVDGLCALGSFFVLCCLFRFLFRNRFSLFMCFDCVHFLRIVSMPRPILAKIAPAAIAHNLERARQATARVSDLAPDAAVCSRVWAVIKANGYGHGIERIFSGLQGADGLALLDLAEALRVRALGWKKPVLLLEGCFEPQDYVDVFEHDLSVVIHHWAQIEWLREIAADVPIRRVGVVLKLNTDMTRIGFDAHNFSRAHAALSELACVGEITLMTHFANADVPGATQGALTAFERCTADIRTQYPLTARSVSNSAAILDCPETHFEWVRPGIMLYGASPSAHTSAADYGLEPAMALCSEIIAVRDIPAHTSIGYGSRFVSERAMRVGVVACGYADGYPRHAPSGTPIWVHGRRTQLIGRVSMDMLMVDLTGMDGVCVGSPVELWGAHVGVDEVANAAGTIGYELLCAVAPRVPCAVVESLLSDC